MFLNFSFRIIVSSSINTLIKLFLLVEREQADEDQDEADLIHELKEEDEIENDRTEDDYNDDKSGIIFIEFIYLSLLPCCNKSVNGIFSEL